MSALNAIETFEPIKSNADLGGDFSLCCKVDEAPSQVANLAQEPITAERTQDVAANVVESMNEGKVDFGSLTGMEVDYLSRVMADNRTTEAFQKSLVDYLGGNSTGYERTQVILEQVNQHLDGVTVEGARADLSNRFGEQPSTTQTDPVMNRNEIEGISNGSVANVGIEPQQLAV